jgi:hypothetical protein
MNKLKAFEKIITGVLVFLIQAWLLKACLNWVGPAQGVAPISWLQAMCWMIAARILFGTGDIASSLKRGANK